MYYITTQRQIKHSVEFGITTSSKILNASQLIRNHTRHSTRLAQHHNAAQKEQRGRCEDQERRWSPKDVPEAQAGDRGIFQPKEGSSYVDKDKQCGTITRTAIEISAFFICAAILPASTTIHQQQDCRFQRKALHSIRNSTLPICGVALYRSSLSSNFP